MCGLDMRLPTLQQYFHSFLDRNEKHDSNEVDDSNKTHNSKEGK